MGINDKASFACFFKIKKYKVFNFVESQFIVLTSFFVLVAIAYLGIIEVSHYKFNGNLMTFQQIFSFFVWFMPEVLLLYCFALLFYHKNKFIRSIFYVGFIIFFLIYLGQAASIYMTNDLISVLALENIQFIGLITRTQSFKFSVSFLALGIISFIVVMELFKENHIKITKKMSINIICATIILFAYQIFYNFTRAGVTNNGFILNRQTPVAALFYNVAKLHSGVYGADMNLNLLQKLELNYNKNSKYPFMKNQIFSSPIKYSSIELKSKPNIIVFFIEGLAARSINCYGSKFNALTPNIDNFAKNAMKVENYYNHTAATYRGLHGQLCSIYPFKGVSMWNFQEDKKVKSINYSSVPDILHKYGYDSAFFYSQDKSLAELFKMLKFKNIYNSEKIIKDFLQGNEKLVKPGVITDESLFDGLICYLKKRKKTNPEEPFFVGLYNMETHVYFKTSEGGVRYQSMSNDVLDTVHNLDVQFGRFYEYFKNSAYAKNTIVIFTTDHTHYHGDASYRKTVGDNYQSFFVDRIPLLIYNPYLDLPKYYDAKMATSINFAPTLFHMLGINNVPNNFLGQSLFERTKDYGISAIGHQYYFIYKNKIYKSNSKPSKKNEIFKEYIKYIKTFYLMETKNRIFSKEHTQLS